MPILKIARMGHPILRQRAHEVADPTSPDVARLVDAMIETMEDADGTGLAAPQVHVPWRVVVYKVEAGRAAAEGDDTGDATNAPGDQEVPTTALINPVVEPLGDESNVAFEACLSVPGLAGPVRRHSRVRLRYHTLAGETVAREAAGFHARVIQHECDHLDGILYPLRIEDFSQFGFVDELRKGQRAAAGGGEGANVAAADD